MHGPIAIARTIDLMLMREDMQGATLWIPTERSQRMGSERGSARIAGQAGGRRLRRVSARLDVASLQDNSPETGGQGLFGRSIPRSLGISPSSNSWAHLS